jgi:hypothetical protein
MHTDNKSNVPLGSGKVLPVIWGIAAHMTVFSLLPKVHRPSSRWAKRFLVGLAEGILDVRNIPSLVVGTITAIAVSKLLSVPSNERDRMYFDALDDSHSPASVDFDHMPDRQWSHSIRQECKRESDVDCGR